MTLMIEAVYDGKVFLPIGPLTLEPKLNALESDPRVGIVPLTEELYEQAFDLYQNRLDKEWGLVDCISFVVMQSRNIQVALTTDMHFHQAGYRVLLRE